MTTRPSEIIRFWFEGDPTVRRPKWFEKNPDFDRACARYTDEVRAARSGRLDIWAAEALDGLALILLLDQLPRNIFRGAAEAFAADAHAREIARRLLAHRFDQTLTTYERMFLYLPFEHSENLGDQDESVRLFESIGALVGPDTVDYAHRHRDVIRRFGRFPHRNAALGRVSTPEEEEYLAQPGAGF